MAGKIHFPAKYTPGSHSGAWLWNNALLSDVQSQFKYPLWLEVFKNGCQTQVFPRTSYNWLSWTEAWHTEIYSWARSLRVVWRGDPVVGQGVIHIVWTHLVQGGIPDGVLFGEQVCQELCRREESNENEAEVKLFHTCRLIWCVSGKSEWHTIPQVRKCLKQTLDCQRVRLECRL